MDEVHYDNEHHEGDICRVCRMDGTVEKPLHYPCVCTGSIKYIHQDCLVQWLNHSKKEYCELCNHKFIFKPVYSPDMPKSIPLRELLQGLGKNIIRALRFWLHYTLVVLAWLGIVPLTAFRIYKCLFSGSVHSLITLPMDMLSLENIFLDCLLGAIVVAVSVGGFILLLWLREQIVIHGGPDWLNNQDQQVEVFQFDAVIRNLFVNRVNDVVPNNNPAAPDAQQAQNAQQPPQNAQQPQDAQHPQNGIPVQAGVEEDLNPDDNDIPQQEIVDEDNNPIENPIENDDMNNFIGPMQNVPGAEINEDDDDDDDNDDNDDDDDDDAIHNAHADDVVWNADAIMEDLTWEKFLGLDGSFIFLEHVFWIISLNTSFVLVFAFCPYHMGQMLMTILGVNEKFSGTSFDAVVILLVGYLLTALSLVLVHSMLRYTSFRRVRKTIGLCYVILKVALLIAIEIGLFPLVCGWWLDICSLPLFAITPKERKESFLYAPVTATFLHWLVGMLYVFYFAAFIILLREEKGTSQDVDVKNQVLRPGVLWFLRNINDPQFHPVREMIQLSVVRHCRRFILSMIVFGTTVLVLVWIPVQLIKRSTTNLIPFNISLSGDAPISEMSLELLLLQVVLPAFLEQGHARRWLKGFIQYWTKCVAYILDLRSYILGDIELKNLNPSQIVHVDNAGKWQKGAVPRGTPLENPLEGVGSPTVRAYFRPRLFTSKVSLRDGEEDKTYKYMTFSRKKMVIFMTILVLSFVAAAFLAFCLPVTIGRKALSLVFGDVVIHELYTAAAGFYIIWLMMRALSAIKSWYPVGLELFYRKVKVTLSIISKITVAAIALLGFTPLLLGVFFELVVVIPLRVPLDQTPLLYIWQDWALGILHLKIICAVVVVGPDWWLQNAIDRVYRNGFLNMNLTFVLSKIFYPVVTTLLLAITTPYVLTAGMLPLLGFSRDVIIVCLRRIYPIMMFTIVLVGAVIFQGKQFKALYEKIKNEKYLIGKVLVNYEPKSQQQALPPTATQVTPTVAAAQG